MDRAKIPLQERITREWLRENSVVEPAQAYAEWASWLNAVPGRKKNHSAILNKVLALATGLSEGSVRNYRHKDPARQAKVSEETARRLDAVMIALEEELPRRKGKPLVNQSRQIALLSDFIQAPSLYYHNVVINGVLEAAEAHRYSVTIHEISKAGLDSTIQKVILAYRPAGMIIIRHKPGRRALKYLKNEGIPIVLANADKSFYEYPVICNIITVINPAENPELAAAFKTWLQQIPKPSASIKNRKIVLAHMPATDHHRGERVNFIKHALAAENYEVYPYIVNDYSAHNALPIWHQHPDAAVFIALSDQIGVGIQHLLKATGQPFEHRVIGFDDSPLSRQEGVASFGQQLEKVGDMAVNRLLEGIQGQATDFKALKLYAYLRS